MKSIFSSSAQLTIAKDNSYLNTPRTNFNISLMLDQQQWALEMLLGVGCSDKTKRQCIQIEVAKFVDIALRKRWTLIMKVTQG